MCIPIAAMMMSVVFVDVLVIQMRINTMMMMVIRRIISPIIGRIPWVVVSNPKIIVNNRRINVNRLDDVIFTINIGVANDLYGCRFGFRFFFHQNGSHVLINVFS